MQIRGLKRHGYRQISLCDTGTGHLSRDANILPLRSSSFVETNVKTPPTPFIFYKPIRLGSTDVWSFKNPLGFVSQTSGILKGRRFPHQKCPGFWKCAHFYDQKGILFYKSTQFCFVERSSASRGAHFCSKKIPSAGRGSFFTTKMSPSPERVLSYDQNDPLRQKMTPFLFQKDSLLQRKATFYDKNDRFDREGVFLTLKTGASLEEEHIFALKNDPPPRRWSFLAPKNDHLSEGWRIVAMFRFRQTNEGIESFSPA